MIGFLPIVPLLTSLNLAAPHTTGALLESRERDAQIEVVSSPRVAQVRLAELLAEADAIESVAAHGKHVITFVVIRGGTTFELTAQTKRSGEIRSLAIAPAAAALPVQLHGLTWLGAELAEVAAVTRLAVDDEGAVTIKTDDGRRYMAIPGRGSGGAANVAAEARWAAAWNTDDDS